MLGGLGGSAAVLVGVLLPLLLRVVFAFPFPVLAMMPEVDCVDGAGDVGFFFFMGVPGSDTEEEGVPLPFPFPALAWT
jgi:hypothetical protein